jgi:flagellar motor switch protein FliM
MTKPDANQAQHQPWLRAIDFAAPSALAPDQEGRLRKIASDFCDVLGSQATSEHTVPMQFEPLWSRTDPWRTVQPVPAEDSVALTLASSAGGSIFIFLDPTLVAVLVELTLGGELDPSRPPRSTTAVDRSLIAGFIDMVATVYGDLWEEATGADLPLQSIGVPNDIAMELDPNAKAMMVAFEVRVGATYTMLYIAAPEATIKPVAESLSRPSARASSSSEDLARAVRERLVNARVAIDVHLGSARMTARQIAELKVGSRVLLPTPADSLAKLMIEGVPHVSGRLGQDDGVRVIQIAGPGGPR